MKAIIHSSKTEPEFDHPNKGSQWGSGLASILIHLLDLLGNFYLHPCKI